MTTDGPRSPPVLTILRQAQEVGRREEAKQALRRGAEPAPPSRESRLPTTEQDAANVLKRLPAGVQSAIANLKARMPRMPGDLVTQAVWALEVHETPGFTPEDWRQGAQRYARASNGFPTFADWLQHTRDAKAERLRQEQRQAERVPPERRIEAFSGTRRMQPGALVQLYEARAKGAARGGITAAEYDAAVDLVIAGRSADDAIAEVQAKLRQSVDGARSVRRDA